MNTLNFGESFLLKNAAIKKAQKKTHHQSIKAKKHSWTLDKIAETIGQDNYPLLALHTIWQNTVQITDSDKPVSVDVYSPVDFINYEVKCSLADYTKQFIELCHLLGIDTRKANTRSLTGYDFCVRGYEWSYLDLSRGQFYLDWDNETLVSSENLMDDPLLLLRSKTSQNSPYDLVDSWQTLAQLNIVNSDDFDNESLIIEPIEIYAKSHAKSADLDLIYQIFGVKAQKKTGKSSQTTVKILNTAQDSFDHVSPVFHLATDKKNAADEIWWQISSDASFTMVPFNLQGIQSFESTLSLSMLDETFLNPNETYYLRVMGSKNKQWTQWSEPLAFSIKKPQSILIAEFEQIAENSYEINWEREAEAIDGSIEYLVFGSNALDFVPSIYSDIQINEIVDGEITGQENNDNLITITTDTKIVVDGHLAYYRIVARRQGQLSAPSPIIYVYGNDLIQPRTVLQVIENVEPFTAKRVLIPSTYPWTETALPRLGLVNRLYENSLLDLHSYIAAVATKKETTAGPTAGYVKPSHVSKDLWSKMKPYFLPENHPWKPKLDRIFFASRATKNSHELVKAGFKGRVTHVRKIFAGTHPDCPECFFKIYTDSEVTSRYTEWQKWIDRINGRNNVWAVIKKRGFEKWFSVPDKWCYPLPETPAAPAPSRYYRPKDFILVASNQKPYSSHDNEKMFKSSKMTHELLDALYIVLDEAGMWDSMFIFNIPFSRIDNKICFVDTEYSHKWPLRYEKLSRYLSSENRKYWEYLIKHHGPKGYKRSVQR